MWYFDYRTVEQHCQERRRDAAMHRLLKEARADAAPGRSPLRARGRSWLATWVRREALRVANTRVAEGSRIDSRRARPGRARP